MKLVLKVIPKFCGPGSLGSDGLIKVLQSHSRLPLQNAKEIVDRCMFDDETVEVSLPVSANVTELVSAIKSLETPPTIEAEIQDQFDRGQFNPELSSKPSRKDG